MNTALSERLWSGEINEDQFILLCAQNGVDYDDVILALDDPRAFEGVE